MDKSRYRSSFRIVGRFGWSSYLESFYIAVEVLRILI